MGGVVSAGDATTATAGKRILDEGGNAIDAVVAAAFASWVVEKPLGSPAGAGLLLHGNAREGYELVDFFTRVPGLGLPPVDPSALDFRVVTVDYGPTSQPFHIGRGSAALPTCVFGLVDAHAQRGRLPLAAVVQPALELARDGFVLSPHVRRIYEMLDPILSATPSVAALHHVDGAIPAPGVTQTSPALARFFAGIAEGGRAFLDGPWTDALVEGFGVEAGGRLTREDFAQLTITRRPPLMRPFQDHHVLTPSPPASGGTLVTLALQLAERMGLCDQQWMSPAWAAGVVRVLRAVSIARASGFDARILEPGVEDTLLDDVAIARWQDAVAAEERSIGETTHISVIDADGHAAGMTMSNGEGCGYAVDRYGVHVNNFLGEEDINPGGFHAQPAGTRMTTMMTPTIVTDADGEPVMVAGSGGANRIRSAVFLAVLAHVGHRRSLDEAANAPRLHVEGDHVWFEEIERLAGPTAEAVRSTLPSVQTFDHKSMFFGGVNLAGRRDGRPDGAGDRRRGGVHRT
jgi:gamma-glutamyltranspeptidase/glutathione hydrolase